VRPAFSFQQQDDADGRDRRPQDWRHHQGQDHAEWLRGERPGHSSLHGLLRADGRALEASTFHEAFTFSAFLRQDSSVLASKEFDSVDEVLDLRL